jgi:anion-transporting  ArsA/GET3 family ATPase
MAARQGKRTLVCEMDAKDSLAAAVDSGPLAFAPTEVRPGLHAMAMSTEDSLREYLRLFVRIPLVGRIGPLARVFDFVAAAAPGVKEILAVGKLCYEVRERHYDLVVVDAEASGHIVAQIAAPQVIRDLVQVGMVREQTDWMQAILTDAATTGLVVVTTPEEMPVTETIELLARVRDETDVAVAGVVANRVLPALFSTDEAEVFARLHAAEPLARLHELAGPQVGTVFAAAALTQARWHTGADHLQRLRAALAEAGPGGSGASARPVPPLVLVPELFTKAGGRRVVTQVADALAEELD